MRIFVMLSRIPWPLEKGDKLRAYNQIRCLAKNHEVILCALNDDAKVDKMKAFAALQPYCASINFIDIRKLGILFNLMRAFLTGMPMQCGYFFNSRAKAKVHRLIAKYKPDMLFGQLLRVAPYLIDENVSKTLDYQDVFSMGVKRMMAVASCVKKPIFRMEYNRLRRYEREVFDRFDVKTIICDADRKFIDHERRNEILIVPNGVDHQYYTPRECEKKYDVVFSGNMSYPPNIDAVEYMSREILPIVWKTLPNTTFYVAGATPDARVKNCANDRIIISGWLDDMREAYAQSRVFIAPMRIGTGLQNKLLEAMSMGLPSITTPLANDSLGAENGSEILVGSNAEELAQHIITLLTDNDKARRIAKAGFDFTNRVYDWDKATRIMEDAMNRYVK